MFRGARRAVSGCENATSFARRRTFPVLIPFLIRILPARSCPKFGAGVHDAGRRGDDPTRTAEAYGPGECRKEKNFSSFDFRAISVGQRAGRRTIRIEPDSLSRFTKEEGGADVAVSFVCDTGKRGMETQKRVSAKSGHPLLCRSSTE